MKSSILAEINRFLLAPTPLLWIENALSNISTLLIDHANCEKKAASTALNLIYRYEQDTELLYKMSRLAREELRHFEQVAEIMEQRDIGFAPVSASRYAAGLREHVRTCEPARLVDILIVGAIIEARSCERFAALAPHLDPELGAFYLSLLRSEGRHYRDYLRLAQKYCRGGNFEARLELFLEQDKKLVSEPDTEFRFHSGPVVP